MSETPQIQPSPDRRLVITADDFGLSSPVNAAIKAAHERGVLTSASLMAGEAGFDEAVHFAKAAPRLSVGVHLVLVKGRAVLSESGDWGIADAQGNFPESPTRAGLRCFFSRRAREGVRRELRAQIDRVLGAGIKPAHLDGHLHFHLHPVVFETARQLALAHGVSVIRVPKDNLAVALAYDASNARAARFGARLFAPFVKRMQRKLRQHGLACVDTVFGHLRSGRMEEQYVLHVLDRLESGTHEIYFHPSTQGAQASELDVLLSPRVRQRLVDRGIQMIGTRDVS